MALGASRLDTARYERARLRSRGVLVEEERPLALARGAQDVAEGVVSLEGLLHAKPLGAGADLLADGLLGKPGAVLPAALQPRLSEHADDVGLPPRLEGVALTPGHHPGEVVRHGHIALEDAPSLQVDGRRELERLALVHESGLLPALLLNRVQKRPIARGPGMTRL